MEQTVDIQASPGPGAAVGLRYVTDGDRGYQRLRRGKGFSYLDPEGRRVTDPALRARFDALVIPPAWTKVWICPDENGHIQATGRDEKGRKQYIYHPDWDQIRNLNKFGRMVSFSEALPALRERVDQDLGRRTLSREKVAALVVRLMEETLIRIGNAEYARSNQSFGLTTLQDEHITVRGARVMFSFRGKSGKQQELDLTNRRLARLVQRCQELPGQQLFQYVGDDGECCQSITSSDINAYLREVTGQEFSAKDFRTWGGTTLAAVELYELGPAQTEKETKKNITTAIKRVAEALGNTPTVCRQYYVHPAILEAYENGRLFERMQKALLERDQTSGLDPHEAAVLHLLRDWEKASA